MTDYTLEARLRRLEVLAGHLLRAIELANAEEGIAGRLDQYAYLYSARQDLLAALEPLHTTPEGDDD